MKRILHYLVVCVFLLPTFIYSQSEVSTLTQAKNTVNKHVKALLECLQRKKCTPEAYKSAAIAISALIPMILGIGTTIGLIIKKRKSKDEEEVSLERKHHTKEPPTPPQEWSEFIGAEPEPVEFGSFQGAQPQESLESFSFEPEAKQ